jgi:hypothetical protein
LLTYLEKFGDNGQSLFPLKNYDIEQGGDPGARSDESRLRKRGNQ